MKILNYLLPPFIIILKKIIIRNIYYFAFKLNQKSFIVRDNSVLLIEFYPFHGENLPSLTRYLLDLGYNVDIIFGKHKINSRNSLELFSCFTGDNRINVRIHSFYYMNHLLLSSVVKLYKHILIVSFYGGIEKDYLKNVDLFILKPVYMMHNPSVSHNYFKTSKIISPVKMECVDRRSPNAVSIHYFGNFEKKDKSETTTFVTLNTENLERRNLNLLFDACDKLYAKGIENFYIKIIGKGFAIPERFHSNFKNFGYLGFQEMYKQIHESDFFLALIDQASIQYTNKASGSYGLSYGFLKPILLHRKFSYVSGFNDENGILYDDNDFLADAMEKCINMPNECYSSLTAALETSSKELYKTSLNNLKETLEAPFQYHLKKESTA